MTVFDHELLAQLQAEEEILVETAMEPGAAVHRTIIWVVVDEHGRALIRSVRGPTARWYREARANPDGAVHVAGRRIAAHFEEALDAERIAACSRALREKYAGDPSLPSMLRDEVLETTLEVHPA